MKKTLKKYILPEKTDARWWCLMGLSFLLPMLILVYRPIGLDLRQAAVVASVVLTIIWWSSGIVKKIPASVFLTLMFCMVSGVDRMTVFSFPMSETFPMIVITYLFSQGIANSGLIDRIFQPFLLRVVHTPCQCLIAIAAIFYLTMYVIPQPLARLIVVATVFHQFLTKTDLPERSRSVLMYGVFLFYAVVNMSAKDADMIMNYVAAGFSEVQISNGMWMYYMMIPTLITCFLVALLFAGLFRRELMGHTLTIRKDTAIGPAGTSGANLAAGGCGDSSGWDSRQKAALVVIVVTVILWMTRAVHGINNTVITLVATAGLFGLGILHKEDWKTIDVTTLIFLTAAFSIGGVMKACGAADKVFGLFRGIFPAEFSVRYLFVMILVAMLLHMILGSNTTTLSVVVPGMMLLCSQVVKGPVIVFTAIISVSFHAILPFHSVSMMIGASNGYFPADYVTKMGIPVTCLVYLVAAGVFLPYWHLVGLI